MSTAGLWIVAACCALWVAWLVAVVALDYRHDPGPHQCSRLEPVRPVRGGVMSDWREAAIEAGWAQHDMVRAAILSDLRAKVEALRRPPAHPTRPTSNGPHCQCNPCVSNRALDRVLALLDAAQHRELVDGNSQPLEQVASRVRAEVAEEIATAIEAEGHWQSCAWIADDGTGTATAGSPPTPPSPAISMSDCIEHVASASGLGAGSGASMPEPTRPRVLCDWCLAQPARHDRCTGVARTWAGITLGLVDLPCECGCERTEPLW